jgi:hypothetical protein
MKLALFATAFAALASVGFAESSIRANDAGVATTGAGDAPAAVVGEVAGDKKRNKRRGLGKKADGKDPDGYLCKNCCNDDWYCGGD